MIHTYSSNRELEAAVAINMLCLRQHVSSISIVILLAGSGRRMRKNLVSRTTVGLPFECEAVI